MESHSVPMDRPSEDDAFQLIIPGCKGKFGFRKDWFVEQNGFAFLVKGRLLWDRFSKVKVEQD